MKAPVSSFMNEGIGENSFPGGIANDARVGPTGAPRVPDCVHFPKK
ncbi:hypothetical protein [uncultured Bilophila sp.]|nr:hypothetical protein [uncultured Bilophila sp.]